ncbi:hypothetical protein CRG98_028099 [Punica granatum]|uniref:Disease resistance protein At4g27190-like leucine-rich repeats domain-containing protein n=1 Tax=Punica granatum TaxID=22663 RepID=A0A2I0J5P1_PUNGR|nr:hypothetical protein CRG98_028099 [Punica granatum]
MARAAAKLTEIFVGGGDMMKAIIMDESEEQARDMESTIGFPHLKVLTIKDCPRMMGFYTCLRVHTPAFSRTSCCGHKEEVAPEQETQARVFFNDKVLLPNLEELKLTEVGYFEQIWVNELPETSFAKLTSISIFGLHRISSVFPVTLAERLQNLEHVSISCCSSVETLFEPFAHDSKDKHKAIMLPKVKTLSLRVLKKLKHLVDKFFRISVGFPSLIEISVEKCHQLVDLIPFATATTLSKLEILVITNCKGMEEVVSQKDRDGDEVNLPNLEDLLISEVKVEEMWHWEIPTGSFLKLKLLEVVQCAQLVRIFPSDSDTFRKLWSIKVSSCQNLTNVFPVSVAKNLGRLQLLCVDECELIEHVVAEGNIWREADKFVELTELTSLTLKGLQNLSRFCQWNYTLEMPSLNKLDIENCGGLEEIWEHLARSIKLALPSLSLENLTSLEVSNCHVIKAVMTIPVARSLKQLREMSIKECNALSEVVGNYEYGDGSPEEIAFERLKYLSLESLMNITQFFSGSHILIFPSLISVRLEQCPVMKIFSQGDVVAPKLEQFETSWRFLEHKTRDLNANVEHCFSKKYTLEPIKSLKLSESPDWREIWLGHLPSWSFKQLESLTIEDWGSLSRAIPFDKMLLLSNLKFLEVRNCAVVEVFESPEANEPADKIFLDLCDLCLRDLPNLRLIFPDQDIQKDFSFSCLVTIKVHNCRCLSNLLTPTTAQNLPCLQVLEIKDCHEMKQIIAREKEWEEVPQYCICFPGLESLVLESLSALMSFYPGDYILDCPSLAKITINNCPNMNSFTCSSLMDNQRSRELSGEIPHEPFFCEKNLRSVWYAEPEAIVNFENLEQVHLWGLPKLEAFYPGLHSTAWCGLIELVVYRCDRVQTFASECQSFSKALVDGHHEILVKPPLFLVDQDEFCSLETVSVVYNEMMKEMWGGQFPAEFFPKLKSLEIKNNDFKPAIFTRGVLQWLHHLQKLFLSRCCFEEIDLLERPAAQNQDKTSTGTVSRLRKLKLKLLPGEQELRHEEPVDLVASQHLEVLQVSICPGFTGLDQLALSFQVLMVLEVSVCHESLYLMTSSMARSLTQLTRMIVADCNNMKEIVIDNEVSEGGNEIAFERLEQLTLHSLPNLESFCSGNFPLKFPSLTEVTLTECPQMECFSCGALRTPLLAEVHVAGSTIFFPNRNLNAIIRHTFEESMKFHWNSKNNSYPPSQEKKPSSSEAEPELIPLSGWGTSGDLLLIQDSFSFGIYLPR